MSVSGLKAELKFLESIFDPNHERFRIIDWKPDELSCQFNVTGEKLLIIHCNITVSPRPSIQPARLFSCPPAAACALASSSSHRLSTESGRRAVPC